MNARTSQITRLGTREFLNEVGRAGGFKLMVEDRGDVGPRGNRLEFFLDGGSVHR